MSLTTIAGLLWLKEGRATCFLQKRACEYIPLTFFEEQLIHENEPTSFRCAWVILRVILTSQRCVCVQGLSKRAYCTPHFLSLDSTRLLEALSLSFDHVFFGTATALLTVATVPRSELSL